MRWGLLIVGMITVASSGERFCWRPNPGKQTEVLRSTAYEIGYGGARGGGKTDAGIAFMARPVNHAMYRGLVIRRNADDLKDWTDRAQTKVYQHLGARRVGNPPEFHFPSGAIVRTGHLKDAEAYTKYQGHEYQRMCVEELGQIARLLDYLKLLGSCRSTVEGLRPQAFTTFNWGGAGHAWIKRRFYDPAKPGTKFRDPESGLTRVFIPSRIEDNPILMQADPGYVRYLEALPEPLRSAWRYGDPDAFAGQYFVPFYTAVHVIDPFGPFLDPSRWGDGGFLCFVGMDWGFHHPFAAVYMAVDVMGNHYCYREIHGSGKSPQYWAEEMVEQQQPDEPIQVWVMGGDAWRQNVFTAQSKQETPLPGPQHIAEAFHDQGIYVVRAADQPGTRVPGWHHLLELLDWKGDVRAGGVIDWEGGKRPRLFIIRGACPVLEEQFEGAIQSETRPEDVHKGNGNDDAIDAARYVAMYAREAGPIVTPKPELRQEIEKLMLEGESHTGMYEW